MGEVACSRATAQMEHAGDALPEVLVVDDVLDDDLHAALLARLRAERFALER